MAFTTLLEASSIYDCAENVAIRRHRVDCPPLTSYSRILTRLRRSLGEDAENDYWREVMWRAYWYRSMACSAPLPLCHLALRGARLLADLQRHLASCEEIAPHSAPLVRQMLQLFKEVLQIRESPLLDEIVTTLDFEDATGSAILVARSHLIQPTQELLDRTPALEGAEAVHLSELHSGATYSHLFVIGAGHWYGPSVFSAPRAPLIDVLRYSFTRDGWKPSHAFNGARPGSRWPPPRERVDDADEPDQDLDKVELPALDMQHIVARAGSGSAAHSHEAVQGRLFLLDGDVAVFLEAEKDSRAFVIDLDADGDHRIRRLPVTALEPGTFLLLRTEGGGDYIVPIADRLMGAKAATARSSLSTWKTLLRNRVKTLGLAEVVTELERRGGTGIDGGDVRRWMSSTTIGTNSRDNFLAIMRYTGLEPRADEYRRLMILTQNAHKQAGQVIRQLLEQEVERANLRTLQKQGTMEFELPDRDAGSLTAFRIEEIFPETIAVLPSRLSHPFRRGDPAWLA